VGAVQAHGSIVLLKVQGQLASGRASDIVIGEAREALDQAGSSAVFINRNKLKGAEMEKIKVDTGPRDEIEDKLFTEYIQSFGSKDERFSGDRGLGLCKDLLEIVRVPKPEGTTTADHHKILLKKSLPVVSKRVGGDD
jgi:exonuclease SbcD